VHAMLALSFASCVAVADGWAEIRVVDAASGRGVPLVELESVHRVRFVTDNAGRVALAEPDLLGREVAFTLKSHGYEIPVDPFGLRGVRVTPKVGAPVTITLKRTQLAERLCRLTGEGRWRDSALLGYPLPRAESPGPGRVAGQDSIQPIVHDGKLFCFWGDTLRLEHPLGLLRMAGATVDLATLQAPGFDLENGLPYDYFVDRRSGFARAMIPLADRPEGVVWVAGFAEAPDAGGAKRMVAWYSRRASLEKELEGGLCAWDEKQQIFESVKVLPPEETWRHPAGHPIEFEEEGTRWLLYGSPCPNVRVPAKYEAVLDPAQYEALTCVKAGGDGETIDRDREGRPLWRWQKELPPVDSKREATWVHEGKLVAEQARFLPANAADAKERVLLHSGTVRWNEWRKRWINVACQIYGTSSMLGEVWYAESRHPTGPFTKAVKVATHEKMSLYNVCHHALLDRDGGKTIHFEGTYTNDFSGNPDATPRYQYNQLLFRLDLAREELKAAWAE